MIQDIAAIKDEGGLVHRVKDALEVEGFELSVGFTRHATHTVTMHGMACFGGLEGR